MESASRRKLRPRAEDGRADAHGGRAHLGRVEDVAREGRPAADDLVAGVEERHGEVVDDCVGARGHWKHVAEAPHVRIDAADDTGSVGDIVTVVVNVFLDGSGEI